MFLVLSYSPPLVDYQMTTRLAWMLMGTDSMVWDHMSFSILNDVNGACLTADQTLMGSSESARETCIAAESQSTTTTTSDLATITKTCSMAAGVSEACAECYGNAVAQADACIATCETDYINDDGNIIPEPMCTECIQNLDSVLVVDSSTSEVTVCGMTIDQTSLSKGFFKPPIMTTIATVMSLLIILINFQS